MSGERDDEDLEGLLGADPLPDSSSPDPLAALLNAAATTDPDRALHGEEAAAAAFRAAFTPQAPNSAPHRRPLKRIRTRRGATVALLTVVLLAIAALALPRLAGRDPHHSPSLTATTAPLAPPPASPRASNTTPRPLDDNATLTSTTPNPSNSSTLTSAAPDLESAATHAAKHAVSPAHSHAHHTRAAKK